jgi:hypothetical protein
MPTLWPVYTNMKSQLQHQLELPTFALRNVNKNLLFLSLIMPPVPFSSSSTTRE